MYVVHGTRKFLDRVGRPRASQPFSPTTTALGDWYVTVLFRRPQLALFVNEATLLPVVVLHAPAATVARRFQVALATVLRGHGVGQAFIDREILAMNEYRLSTTQNRSVVGILNEFTRLTEAFASSEGELDLLHLSLWLAMTPCGPLYARQGSPDRELAAIATRV